MTTKAKCSYIHILEIINRKHPAIFIDILDSLQRHDSLHWQDLTEVAGYCSTYIRAALIELDRFKLINHYRTKSMSRWGLTERGRIAIALHNAKVNIRNMRATKLRFSQGAGCTRDSKAA